MNAPARKPAESTFTVSLEDLDLDLGLSLEADSEAGALQGKSALPDAAAGAGEPSVDFRPDLRPSAQAEPEASLPALEELEISLDDLDLPDVAAVPAAGEASGRVGDQSSELELDLDLADTASESSAATHGAAADADIRAVLESAPAPSGEDMLDLSDLEAMLESEATGGASAKPAAATEGIDLELDLGAAVEDALRHGSADETVKIRFQHPVNQRADLALIDFVNNFVLLLQAEDVPVVEP